MALALEMFRSIWSSWLNVSIDSLQLYVGQQSSGWSFSLSCVKPRGQAIVGMTHWLRSHSAGEQEHSALILNSPDGHGKASDRWVLYDIHTDSLSALKESRGSAVSSTGTMRGGICGQCHITHGIRSSRSSHPFCSQARLRVDYRWAPLWSDIQLGCTVCSNFRHHTCTVCSQPGKFRWAKKETDVEVYAVRYSGHNAVRL